MTNRKAKYLSWAEYYRETKQFPRPLKSKDEREIFMKLNNMRKEIDNFVEEIYGKYDGLVPIKAGKTSLTEYIISLESDGYIENDEIVIALNYMLPRFAVKDDFYKLKGIDRGIRLATYCAIEKIALEKPLPCYEKALITIYAGVKNNIKTDTDNRLYTPIINGIRDASIIEDDDSNRVILNFRVVQMENPVTIITIKDAETLLENEHNFAKRVAEKVYKSRESKVSNLDGYAKHNK